MNIENQNKELLLKDLCARLPYGVKVQVPETLSINALKIYAIEQMYQSTFYCKRNEWICKFWNNTFARLDEIKPYLRAMSSMTEEEHLEIVSLCGKTILFGLYDKFSTFKVEVYDWLNAHHFDYRGLIEKGLALTAPKGMYKDGFGSCIEKDYNLKENCEIYKKDK